MPTFIREHRLAVSLTLAIPLLVGVVLALWPKDPPMGEIGYDISMALLSACNQRDDARLVLLQEEIDQATANAQLSENEAQRLREIIAEANDQQWQRAAAQTRTWLQAQLRPSPLTE